MEKVLIVAKTHMRGGVCVGGITGSNRSVRLIPPDRYNHPEDTELDVGQVWEMEFRPVPQIKPPHTEDVIITWKRFAGCVKNLRETLLKRVHPWQGGPEQLFDGLLTFTNQSAYVSEYAACPNVSTGFWLPDVSLLQGTSAHFIVQTKGIQLQVKHVGCAPMVSRLPANTLIRVSLARWWDRGGVTEKRCYLQISGWYL
jgi:hypothetical protein